MTTAFRTISTELVTDALERAQLPQKALCRTYQAHANVRPGFGIELAVEEIAGFAAELVVAAAQEKAIARVESDARDATADVRRMLHGALVVPPKTERTIRGRWVAYPAVLWFPGWSLID